MLIKINLLPKKKTIFKTINAFNLVLLILNMSLGGVLVALSPVNACWANIKIIKNDLSDTGKPFEFSTNINSNNFYLSDNGTNSASSTTFSQTHAGEYIITEINAEDENWNLVNIECISSPLFSTTFEPNFTRIGNGIKIEYNSGDGNIECTFTNEYNPQQPTNSIKIIKDAIPDSGEEFQFTTTTNLTPSPFNLSDNGTNSVSSTTFSNLSIGTYTITETAKIGWNLDSISCRSEGTNGASTTATIVNANGLAGKVEIELYGNDINTICTFTNKPIITKIDCPFTATGDQILVNFNKGLLSNRPESENRHQEEIDVLIPAGNYKVTLSAWDGYLKRKDEEQPHEQYKVLLKYNDELIAESGETDDLIDFVISASTTDMVNNFSNPLVVSKNANKVSSWHAYFPYISSPNSLDPICALFDPIIETGSITACKYIDDDGVISDPNVDIHLSTTTPWTFILDNGTATTSLTSDNSGCAVFDNLALGNYIISEVEQTEWTAISATSTKVKIASEDLDQIVAFVNYKEPPIIKGSIEICKYYDNGNIGTYEIATDIPMEWPIIINHPDGTITEVNTSSSTGCVILDNLELGNYIVREMPIVGGRWINSYPQNNQHNIILDDETTKKVYFLNYQYEEELGSIKVCKYIDDDGIISNPNIDINLSTTTPWEFILDNGRGTTTATTTESGCTTFNNLNSGNYDISEIQKQYWQALSPSTGATSTILEAGEHKTIDFVNYYTKPYCGDGNINEELGEVCDLGADYNGIPCTPAYGENCSYCSNICKLTELTGPYCGDGVKDDNEECDGGNNCNSLCKKTGGGGGGGGSTIALKISDEKIYCFGEESVRITWRTNYYKESVIFYGEQSQKNAGTPPNYGYASSTKKTTEKATFHSVVVNDIKDNTYYFRPMSGNVKGKELSIDMTECRPEVKGEEGFPVLTIDKTIDTEFINPGDKNIEYTILVSNTGNLDAFDVVLTDSLPDGLTFASSTDIIKTWNLGDMKPGENKTIAYFVDSNKEIKEGVYINIAEVKASNHNKVSDSASLEAREIKVLAVTGFNINEFIAISLSSFLLFGASFSLKKIQL